MYRAWSVARLNFYGVTGYPTVIFDGVLDFVGASGGGEAMANEYRPAINTRLAIPSNLEMHGFFNYSLTTISLSVTITKVDAVALTAPTLVMAVLEDGIHSGGRVYNHVVRTGSSQTITLVDVGDSVVVAMDFPVSSSWVMDNIKCTAWVQKGSGNLEVYQACELPVLLDFTFDFADNIVTIPEGNGEALFEGLLTNLLETTTDFTVSLNNTFSWPCDFMVAGEADYHTDPSVVTLTPGEAIGVTMRVTTDSDVRIGQGAMQVQSPNRVVSKSCRVFNGGPAILLVDDDGRYPMTEEIAIKDALTANGTLYDHWDVRRGYGRAPTAEEMCQYDATIWHVGRQADMMDEADVLVLTEYLNAGGGLILSYQQFLTFADTSSAPVVPAFVSDYLGIDSYVIDAGADSALGVAGDPISDGMEIYMHYSSSVLNVADALTPNALGTTFLHSSTGNQVAIRSDLPALEARAVYFACLLNAMWDTDPDPNNLGTVLDRSIAWVLERGSAAVDDGAPLSALSGIGEIAPNPFRVGASGMTSIRLRVADSAAGQPVRLDVFDLNGRLVRNLVDGALPAGTAVATWNGTGTSGQPVGSGIYYLRFTTPAGADRAPLVIVR